MASQDLLPVFSKITRLFFKFFASSVLLLHPQPPPCPRSVSLSFPLIGQYPCFHLGFQEFVPIMTNPPGQVSLLFWQGAPLSLQTMCIIACISLTAPKDHWLRNGFVSLGEGSDLGGSGLRQSCVGGEKKRGSWMNIKGNKSYFFNFLP